MRLLTIAALAALSLNSYAVEYTPATDVPFEIIHMHDTTTWEKVCESFDGVCNVPTGTYQVTLLDRNWGELHVIRNVKIHDGLDAQVPTYSIGSTGPAGGFVFYVTNDGLHGLEAAPVDLGNAVWGCPEELVAGATGTGLGSGAHNTQHIVDQCGAGTAAALADAYEFNGYYDWFLPSKRELNFVHANLSNMHVGGFTTQANYWSSSEWNIGAARVGVFKYLDWGAGHNRQKTQLNRVRAVRAF